MCAGPNVVQFRALDHGVWATVGSCNLDFMSMRYNLESNAVVLGDTLADPLTKLFHRDLDHAREIQLAQWRQRSGWQMFLHSLAYRLRNWL